MTVKEIVSLLRDFNHIRVYYGVNGVELNPRDQFQMDSLGDYIVDGIYGTDDRDVEIVIKMVPVKKECA